uniref:Uncharacterized protein n=2 Tax=Cacopsylla melanoneura TaxID=428564 RepID=A0A8D8TVG0_9HEMI
MENVEVQIEIVLMKRVEKLAIENMIGSLLLILFIDTIKWNNHNRIEMKPKDLDMINSDSEIEMEILEMMLDQVQSKSSAPFVMLIYLSPPLMNILTNVWSVTLPKISNKISAVKLNLWRVLHQILVNFTKTFFFNQLDQPYSTCGPPGFFVRASKG